MVFEILKLRTITEILFTSLLNIGLLGTEARCILLIFTEIENQLIGSK